MVVIGPFANGSSTRVAIKKSRWKKSLDPCYDWSFDHQIVHLYLGFLTLDFVFCFVLFCGRVFGLPRRNRSVVSREIFGQSQSRSECFFQDPTGQVHVDILRFIEIKLKSILRIPLMCVCIGKSLEPILSARL
jgi:hypothetical protein